MSTWEIEISDARGAWGCKGFRANGPGIYTTDDPFVAELAATYEHIYVRELVEDEEVEEGPADTPETSAGPLTVQDLRADKPKMQKCDDCGREYKYSHKRCPGPADDVVDEEPETEPAPEADQPVQEVVIKSIVTEE